MKNMEMCRKWLPSFIDISFLLRGVEMCVFLILNVVMVTGLLGCCFLHPANAAVLSVWWSGCPQVQFEAGYDGDQPDHPAHLGLATAKPGAGIPRDGFCSREEGWKLCDHTPTTLKNSY